LAVRADGTLTRELLTHQPLGCRFLALPGLKQLFGQPLQGLRVMGLVDGAAHALQLELLAQAEAEGLAHGA
jgi:hypothetical protein